MKTHSAKDGCPSCIADAREAATVAREAAQILALAIECNCAGGEAFRARQVRILAERIDGYCSRCAERRVKGCEK
jgi:hypothetical protein